MNYMKVIEEFFWNNLEDDELQVTDDNFDRLTQAIRLMEIDDESIANKEVEESSELKSLFDFNNCETLNIIDAFSEEENSNLEESVQYSESESSEEEVFPENFRMNNQTAPPKQETGESSGGRTEDTTDENKGSRKRKGNFYPTSDVKNITNIYGSNILNIDGKINRKELIDKWAQEISLIIQTNSEAYDDQNTVLLLMEHKSTGVVNSMIKRTTWTPVMNPLTAYEEVINAIYTLFLGINLVNNKIQELAKIVSNAKAMLTKMQLCNICFLDQFYCDYEKYLFQLNNQDEYKKFVRDYLLKIPFIGEKALDRFNLEATGSAEYSLGYAQRIVKEEISKICDLTRKQKQLKTFTKRCCEKIVDQPFEYGCKTVRKTPKRNSYKKHTKKYRFVRKKKPFKPGKYVKRKSDNKFSNEKPKFCPKGKKNCRCWICNEEGHYANECPNRKKHDNKVRMLEQVYSLGFVPIEEPYEDVQKVYILEEKLDLRSEDDTESNESTSSESD